MVTYHSALTLNSSNGKTGNIAVSTTSRESCPTICPFIGDQGCYAEAGYYTKLHWDRVTSGTRGVPPLQFIKAVHKLPGNEIFRHNVAGDLWSMETNPSIMDFELVKKLSKAASHLYAAWTYTHYELDGTVGLINRSIIKSAEKHRFIINASTESLDVAAQRHKDGLMTTVVQPAGLSTSFRHNGVSFVQCPATLPNSDVTCRTCGGRFGKPLCATVRNVVVVFPAHGSRKSKATSHCS